MTQCVPLRELPDNVQFPEELQSRIRFHPERQELEFDGFMSKKDFDRLLCLSKELAYQRALESLFHKCAFQQQGTEKTTAMPWLAIAVAAAAVVSIAVFGVRIM